MELTEYLISGVAALYGIKEAFVVPGHIRRWRNGRNGNADPEQKEELSLGSVHRQIRHASEEDRLAHSGIAEALKYQTDVLKELITEIRRGREASAAESIRSQETLVELRIELAKAGK